LRDLVEALYTRIAADSLVPKIPSLAAVDLGVVDAGALGREIVDTWNEASERHCGRGTGQGTQAEHCSAQPGELHREVARQVE